jgi:hypothetical protein
MITRKPRIVIKQEALKVLESLIANGQGNELMATEARGVLRGLELSEMFVGSNGADELSAYRKRIQRLFEGDAC